MSLLRKDFYPTPSDLAGKMIGRIKNKPVKVLEPSAGKGDLVECLEKRFHANSWSTRMDIATIEIDDELQATLRGKRYKVIDADFLSFSGPDQFDLIIANPPFDEGDKHLLKAIEIMYRGEIVFLLNAETLRNPYTNTRIDLVKKLKKLDADIEYIQNAFKDAERPTGVEVALVYINVTRNVEDDLFAGADDKAARTVVDLGEETHEVSNRRAVEELVAEYNQIVSIGQETIIAYFKNYPKIGKYIAFNEEAGKRGSINRKGDLTGEVQHHLNEMLKAVRTDFWRRTLELPEVQKRLTSGKRKEFEHEIVRRCEMDFTANNIRQFILNLMGGFEQTLTAAVLDIFDKFTIRHCYSARIVDENVHYFNGWKTNKAFKVGRRVVIPIYGSCGSAFCDSYNSKWKLNWDAAEQLHDIDIVMNYFDAMKTEYIPMHRAIEEAFGRNQNTRIKSTYFTVNCFKKGTIHLTFNDENILRRFNVAACRGKEWLPQDYGTKPYSDMPEDEKAVVNEFEGPLSYAKSLKQPLFDIQRQLLYLTA